MPLQDRTLILVLQSSAITYYHAVRNVVNPGHRSQPIAATAGTTSTSAAAGAEPPSTRATTAAVDSLLSIARAHAPAAAVAPAQPHQQQQQHGKQQQQLELTPRACAHPCKRQRQAAIRASRLRSQLLEVQQQLHAYAQQQATSHSQGVADALRSHAWHV